MAYQVLARQWRPHSFDDVVGQDYTVRALSYALDHQKLHSAYLFTGSHGIGKTSLARILARAINCVQGVSAKPCDTCASCVSMLAGQAVDVIEIDAASRTKVEDTRELLDQVQYAPTVSHYKIYIIDEVHMLSTHSFNALLKTLEEPPAHVLFLLATTHPDKLPVTVRSRCLQFHLRPILSPEIEKQLTDIITAESIIAEPLALAAIAKAAHGSMRDALSLLDQAIAVGQGQVKLTEVSAMLGLASTEMLNAIVEGLLARNIGELIHTVRQYSQAIATLPAQLLELLQQAALYQFAPASVNTQDEQGVLVIRLAKALSQEALQLYYQLSLHAIDDIAKAPTPLLAVEMWLLRLVHFEVASDTYPLPSNSHSPDIPLSSNGLNNNVPLPRVGEDAAKRQERVLGEGGQKPGEGVFEVTKHDQEDPLPSPSPARGRGVDPAPQIKEATLQARTITTVEQQATTLEQQPTAQLPAWSQLLPQLGLTGMVRILAEQADVTWLQADRAQLRLAKSQAGLCQPMHLEAIAAALSKHCNRPVTLTLELVDTPVDSPSTLAAQQAQQQHQTLLTELHTDTNIQAFVKEFDATIGTMTLLSETD